MNQKFNAAIIIEFEYTTVNCKLNRNKYIDSALQINFS